MAEESSKSGSFIKNILSRLIARPDREPIDSIARLNRFVSTRAAFVAQKTLYGYLKTRIGTRYPKAFENPDFVESINIAKMRFYAACLSDLSIYAVARALHGARVTDAQRCEIALACFRQALADNAAEAVESFNPDEPVAEFRFRLGATDWAHRALLRDNFDHSPAALVRWAPIAPELKKYDAEIVENSVKFAWNEIRTQFERRIVPEKVASSLNS